MAKVVFLFVAYFVTNSGDSASNVADILKTLMMLRNVTPPKKLKSVFVVKRKTL